MWGMGLGLHGDGVDLARTGSHDEGVGVQALHGHHPGSRGPQEPQAVGSLYQPPNQPEGQDDGECAEAIGTQGIRRAAKILAGAAREK